MMIKNFDMKRARANLRATIEGVQPAALDFVNWEEFEGDLVELMSGQPSREKIIALFSKTVTAARHAYAEAVRMGIGFKN